VREGWQGCPTEEDGAEVELGVDVRGVARLRQQEGVTGGLSEANLRNSARRGGKEGEGTENVEEKVRRRVTSYLCW
jgi:hypothetical protein